MTAIQHESDLVVLEDLDFDPACESIWCAENPSPAAWVTIVAPCEKCGRQPALFCERCYEVCLDINGEHCWCSVCNHVQPFRIIAARRL